MSEPQGLTPEEAAELVLPPLPPERARVGSARRVTKADLKSTTTSGNAHGVSPEEYTRRLHASTVRDHRLFEQAVARRTKVAVEEWLSNGPPARFVKADTKNPVILDRVNRVLTGRGTHQTSLIFYGDTGVGKSWEAYGYVNRMVREGAILPGQIVHGAETHVLGRLSSAGYNRPALIEELLSPAKRIYLIDDVGIGHFGSPSNPGTAENRQNLWYVLADHIYSNDLTLIITTNLNSATLPNWIGFRAWDRLNTLVGDRGKIEPGKVNRRASVAEAREQEYRG